ncbi:MAG: 50S ribosomal protein L3 [Deltaproteobacteria bacterium]|nr:50S ribosomal protein L3 [Deltaproteobacteria bacterium]
MSAVSGLLGKKLGMTQVFNPNGTLSGVTAIEVGPCVVVQKRTQEKDGYTALQLGFDNKPERKVSRPETGHFAKAGCEPKRFLKEFRVSEETANEFEVGQAIGADTLAVGDKIDVTGTSQGKGFAGVMKKYGYHGAKATHGVHEAFRHGGSLGQNMTPGRVMKGKRMAGHHGDKRITIQNVEVVRVFSEDNLIFVKGPVPGSKNSFLTIKSAVKKS